MRDIVRHRPMNKMMQKMRFRKFSTGNDEIKESDTLSLLEN